MNYELQLKITCAWSYLQQARANKMIWQEEFQSISKQPFQKGMKQLAGFRNTFVLTKLGFRYIYQVKEVEKKVAIWQVKKDSARIIP